MESWIELIPETENMFKAQLTFRSHDALCVRPRPLGLHDFFAVFEKSCCSIVGELVEGTPALCSSVDQEVGGLLSQNVVFAFVSQVGVVVVPQVTQP